MNKGNGTRLCTIGGKKIVNTFSMRNPKIAQCAFLTD